MDLLPRIHAFLERGGTSPTRLGIAMMGDPRFVFDLEAGRHPRPRTVRRVLDWLEAREGESR